MSLTLSDPYSSSQRVFLDTTVLCGAIRADGLNRQILRLARASVYFTPVISRVCLFEFYRNATNGLGGVKYSYVSVANRMV